MILAADLDGTLMDRGEPLHPKGLTPSPNWYGKDGRLS
jgi:hypothetical protein